jgi:hypothetical protein
MISFQLNQPQNVYTRFYNGRPMAKSTAYTKKIEGGFIQVGSLTPGKS